MLVCLDACFLQKKILSHLFFSELSLCSVDRLLSLMVKHIGCAMCYSQEASELKLNMLESSGCCWLAEL